MNNRYYGSKSKLGVCHTSIKNLNKANSENPNSSKSICQVLESSLVSPIESQSLENQKGEKMASVINITGKDTPISGSSTGTESKNVGGFTKHAQSNRAFSKIQSYANEFVEKIIHSVIEVNDESGKCSRRNSETIYITDTVTSTVLTCSDCPTPKQGSVVMLNDGREEVGAQSDGMNKSILIQTKRILKENIDQQIEDVITESVTKATAITNLNSDNTLRRDECNREGMSDRMVNNLIFY